MKYQWTLILSISLPEILSPKLTKEKRVFKKLFYAYIFDQLWYKVEKIIFHNIQLESMPCNTTIKRSEHLLSSPALRVPRRLSRAHGLSLTRGGPYVAILPEATVSAVRVGATGSDGGSSRGIGDIKVPPRYSLVYILQ